LVHCTTNVSAPELWVTPAVCALTQEAELVAGRLSLLLRRLRSRLSRLQPLGQPPPLRLAGFRFLLPPLRLLLRCVRGGLRFGSGGLRLLQALLQL
jgi:hypothetical protein